MHDGESGKKIAMRGSSNDDGAQGKADHRPLFSLAEAGVSIASLIGAKEILRSDAHGGKGHWK